MISEFFDSDRFSSNIYLIFLGICAISQVGNEENKPRSYGFAYAAGFGYLIFVIAHVNAVFA